MIEEPVMETSRKATLHKLVYQELIAEIKSGRYAVGERLPSETALCERFNTSRITIAKALQNLQRDGLIVRRAGSGSFVEPPKKAASHQFGLLIPDLGQTEIFEPICKGIMSSPFGESHSLIWGNASASKGKRIEDAERLCRQFISQQVSGVFFAPIEYIETGNTINTQLVSALQSAGIPVVLLDRPFEGYTDHGSLDLVGIDNYRAGYIVANHLIQAGARRIAFAALSRSASTIEERIAGYESAIRATRQKYAGSVFLGDVEDRTLISKWLADERPDAIVCGNDVTAAKLMQTLLALGVKLPEEIRMTGMDDVSYARFLPVPLTTIHQNCSEIGHMAMMLMLDRVRNPNRPAVTLRVGFELIVRDSCGARNLTDKEVSRKRPRLGSE